MATGPDHLDVITGRLDPADTHITHQFFIGHDAAHGFAEGGTVHGDIAQHAPGARLHKTRTMQAKQRVIGCLQQMAEQALVGFTGDAFAVVGQFSGVNAGCRQGLIGIQTQLLGMAQVFEQGGHRGVAEVFHGPVLILSAYSEWLDWRYRLARYDSDAHVWPASIGSHCR